MAPNNTEATNTTITTTPSTLQNNTAPTLQTSSIHHLISVKLDTHNYLLWLTQFKLLLKGYDLQGFVDRTNRCPPQTIVSGSSTVENPAYLHWKKQDQILLGWLLSSLTENVLAQVVGLTSSQAVWSALERQYASKSKARIMQLRRELQTIRKGSKSMSQYFLHAKQLDNSLAAAGHPILESDLQQIIQAGLDSSYDAIVTTLTTTIVDISMDDFYSHLQAFDMRLEA